MSLNPKGWDHMAEKKSGNFPWKWALVILLLVVGAIILGSVTLARTSSTEYCISCHEMQSYKTELEKSSHAVDKDKQAIQCAQCHIPHGGLKFVAVKTVSGTKDLWIHYMGDPANLNRRQMQETAHRFVLDENCLACHADLEKDTKGQPLSEIGKLCHDAYLGKNRNTKYGCAGCHQNMAHLPEFDRRYEVNAKFAERLPLEKEKK